MEMLVGRRAATVLRHVAVVVLYALGYTALKALSFSHWQLATGLRLTCLLLMPYRYWPALLLGEAAVLGPIAYGSAAENGLSWALTFPWIFMAATMLMVGYFRYVLPVIDANGRLNLQRFLLCLWAVAIVCMGANMLEYGLIQGLSPSDAFPAKADFYAGLWLIGGLLGIYMITPLAVWMVTTGEWRPVDLARRLARSPVLLHTLCLLLPITKVLTLLIPMTPAGLGQEILRMALFAAPVWMGFRHGWPGACIGGMVASVGVVLAMPSLYDPITLDTQRLMCAALTVVLLSGSVPATLPQRRAAAAPPPAP